MLTVFIPTWSARTTRVPGAPTYVRIRKECPATFTGLYPAFEIQLPVGLDDNQASFNKTNFVAGQTASLNPFTISMLLQSGI